MRTGRKQAEAAVRISGGDVRAVRQLAMTLKMMGDFTELLDHDSALGLYRDASVALDRLSPQDQNTPLVRNSRSSVLIALGDNLRRSGDIGGARAALEQARQIRDQLRDEDPRNILLLRQRVDPYTFLLDVSNKPEQLAYLRTLDEIYGELVAYYPFQ